MIRNTARLHTDQVSNIVALSYSRQLSWLALPARPATAQRAEVPGRQRGAASGKRGRGSGNAGATSGGALPNEVAPWLPAPVALSLPAAGSGRQRW